MKILFLTNSLEFGGIETNLVLLTEEFTRRGHEVVIAARRGALVSAVEENGARWYPLSVRLKRPVDLVRDARAVKEIVRKERPDIIHVFSASLAVILKMSGCGRAIPVVASIMGLVNRPNESRLQVQTRNLLTTLGADKILLISPAIEEHVRKLPLRSSRLLNRHVVGVKMPSPRIPSQDFRRQMRERLGVREDEPVIMTTGRLAPRKSHELFIRAAPHVLLRHPDAKFFILGDGPLRGDLQKEIERLGLVDSVRLVGEVDDVQEHHAAADLYMRPGIVEGFIGITVLEAQALGIPVLAYETEDVKLAIEHPRTGILVKAGDVEAMGKAMADLLDDPKDRRNMVEAAHRHVEATFSIPAIVDGLEVLYLDLRSLRSSSRTPDQDPALEDTT